MRKELEDNLSHRLRYTALYDTAKKIRMGIETPAEAAKRLNKSGERDICGDPWKGKTLIQSICSEWIRDVESFNPEA